MMKQSVNEKTVSEICTKFLNESEISEVPVNLGLLGSMLGVNDVREVEMDEAGKLIPKADGNYAVLLRQSDSGTRKRFTHAHELGHLLVPGGVQGREVVDYEVGNFDKDKTIEFLCDVAAANLLMPHELFGDFVKGKDYSFKTIVDIGKRFDVSLEAAAIQMVKRMQQKRALVVWEYSNKPTEQILLATPTFPGFEDCAPEKYLRVKYAYGFSAKEHIPKSKSLDESEGIIAAAYSDSEREVHAGIQTLNFGTTFSLECGCEAMQTLNGRVLSLLRKK